MSSFYHEMLLPYLGANPKITLKAKLILLFCYACRMMARILQICIPLSCVLMPTLPFNLVLIINQNIRCWNSNTKTNSWSFDALIKRVIIFSFNYILWYMITTPTLLFVTELIVGTMSISVYHSIITRYSNH